MEGHDEQGSAGELARSLQEVLAAVLRGLPEAQAAELAAELVRWLAAERERLGSAAAPTPAVGEREETRPEPAPTVLRKLRLGGREALVPTLAAGAAEPPPALPPAGAPGPREAPVPAAAPEPFFAEADWPRAFEHGLARLRLKLRACELVLRGGRSSSDPPTAAEVRALLDEASRLPDGYVWPLDPAIPLPEREPLELCARAYENLARALEVLRLAPAWVRIEEVADEDFLQLLAEAQSALLWSLQAVDVRRDVDQLLAYRWLREQTATHRVYLPRFMKLETPADPRAWYDLAQRIEQVAARQRDAESSRRETQRLLGKLRYHLERLGRSTDPERERAEWQSILGTLEGWVASGRPPSSRELCALLVDHVDELPDEFEVSPAAQRVLLALDEMLAARPQTTTEPTPVRARGPDVARARALLTGKVVLLIGGHRRAFAAELLERELGLAELRWITTIAHRSLRPLVEEAWKPEVALVVVATRWSDHAFIELKAEAQKARKPFLHLPGGYNPERFAFEVMRQVSEQLGG